MEFTVFVNLSEAEASRLIELIILVIGALVAGILLIRPLVMRLARGRADMAPLPRPLSRQAPGPIEDPEEAGRPGMVKVSVWVPESNAAHVQALARELRRGARNGGEDGRAVPARNGKVPPRIENGRSGEN